MGSDKSKGLGPSSIDMCSQVEFRGFNGRSCGVGLDKYDITKLVAGGEVHIAGVDNLISPISVKKEELYAQENQQTSMRDGLDKFKPSPLKSDEGTTTLEMLTSLKEGESNNIFSVGDLVWGKVMSHPWWPGQIYDESLIPSPQCHAKRDGSVLVAFYGDYSYAWLDHNQIIPFEPHFDEKSNKSKIQSFIMAVEEAIDELKKRAVLGLTCFCQGNFQPTRIEGLYKVDVSGYTPGTIYSSKQIKKSRDGFRPHVMFSFVKKLAMSPRSLQNIYRIINSKNVTAYRKMVFEENDKTYDQAFDEFEKGDETIAFGVKASRSEDPVEFSKEGNQFTDGGKSFKYKGDCSKKSRKGETKRKRRKESPPDDQGCKGKFQKDAFFDHLETKSGEEIVGIYCCKSEKHNKLNDYGTELGNATGAFKHLKQFRSTSYQESYCPEEHEKANQKRTLLKCQDKHMTRKEELRGLKSLHMTKKYGDHKFLTPHGDDVNIQSTLLVQSEKKFTEEPERKAEPTMLVIKFSPQTMLPTASELKAKFACFGPFDESALHISWGSATCQIVFMYKSNAQAAYDYAVKSKTLFNSDVNYHLTDFDGSEKLVGETFDDIQSFKDEPHHMSFQELPLQSDTEMKLLSKENSKCRSDVEAFLKGNTDTNSIVCDYTEVDTSVKVNIGSENCQVVLSEILCSSSPLSSSIEYKHKVGSLDETVVAINAKYSMDEGWKSHYQQNLSAINSSDLSLQLANLLHKCNEILGGIEGSQDQFSSES
ncbi:PWWP domain-containing protein 1-like isoform X2 [Solanum dulcamara]|nr:PWWP domain-containing protein 1-like isoform X2 [Solanum dulcamara]